MDQPGSQALTNSQTAASSTESGLKRTQKSLAVAAARTVQLLTTYLQQVLQGRSLTWGKSRRHRACACEHRTRLLRPAVGGGIWSRRCPEPGLLFAGALSADGRSFMTGGSDGNIRIWDAGLRRTTLRLKAHPGGVRTLAVEPQGRWLISGGWDHTAKIWRMADGRLVRILRGHTDRVIFAAISPDGAVLATAGRDRTVRLWDLQTRQPLHTLTGHRDWVLALAFSPDSRTLVSASKDATVHIWRRSGR